MTVTAKFSGVKYTLGNQVKVIISSANPEKKEVDLMFVEWAAGWYFFKIIFHRIDCSVSLLSQIYSEIIYI